LKIFQKYFAEHNSIAVRTIIAETLLVVQHPSAEDEALKSGFHAHGTGDPPLEVDHA
jgi:hypothetical protein